MLYNLVSNNKDRSYVGIDYEFRNREIALMQINFESKETRYICIVNPGKFDELQMKYLIELMINMKIVKIFHGADSLDIPICLTFPTFTKLFKASRVSSIPTEASEFLC